MSRKDELKHIESQVTDALAEILYAGLRAKKISVAFKKSNGTSGTLEINSPSGQPAERRCDAITLTQQFGAFANLTRRQVAQISARAEVNAARQLNLV